VELEYGECEVLGMCYSEHADSPAITRFRVRTPDHKTVYDGGDDSVEYAVEKFREMLAQFGGKGHVLTPNLNRGRYAAFCRMLQCQPLERDDC
jgi:hypothetical protein